jgi:hypothetical protein
MSLEVEHRRGLVLAHQAAVAGDVRSEDRGKPAAHRRLVVHHKSSARSAAPGRKWPALWHIVTGTARAYRLAPQRSRGYMLSRSREETKA